MSNVNINTCAVVDKQFAKKLVKNYCLGNSRYIKKKNIVKDLLEKITNYRNNKYLKFNEFEFDIIYILAVIKLDKIDCDNYCIERFLKEETKLCEQLKVYFNYNN